MGKSAKNSKIILLAAAALIVAAAGAVFALSRGPRGIYADYDVVVTARNTPGSVLTELKKQRITPVQYEKGRVLYGNGGLISEDMLDEDPAIYICEGEYSAELAPFIAWSGETALVIRGAGRDKTVVEGGTSLYRSGSAGIQLSGNTGSVIEDLSVCAFERGISLENSAGVTVRNTLISLCHYAGAELLSAVGCVFDETDFVENGDPLGMDYGYGLSLDKASRGNTARNGRYKNNANKNAVDFFGRVNEAEAPENTLTLEFEYDINRVETTVADPEQEAENAKPTEAALRFELETAVLDQKGAVFSRSTERVGQFSGPGWVFLFNTKIVMTIDVPEAGSYRIFVVGASDDGNDKCDYFQLNGGTKYLTSYLGKNKGVWQTGQPGTETWENSELHPTPLINGFELNKGANTIVITANWGYCAYDSIILEPIK
ncbi:MAG: right-handed parallel beta-helix repeat-containing protein [Oscillospiraceae bacterium]|jgi:hypothetical protein|nr:right-handed parallel beta-helix repeat-containing protein [Oscillospiraceae bacterium]